MNTKEIHDTNTIRAYCLFYFKSILTGVALAPLDHVVFHENMLFLDFSQHFGKNFDSIVLKSETLYLRIVK